MRTLRVAVVVALAVGMAVSACQPSNQSSVDVHGLVTAGPTCPVVTDPPDPSCADRPVEGATLVVTTDGGSEVMRVTSAADGTFSFALAPGTYRLVPQPVEGLMGTPLPIALAVLTGSSPIDLSPIAYDTGIR